MMSGQRVALIDLVFQGRIEKVKALIADGCDVNEQDYCGGCAVTMAVEQKRLNILEILIAAGANVDVKDPMGRSALSRAKQLKYNEIAQLLEETLALKTITQSAQLSKFDLNAAAGSSIFQATATSSFSVRSDQNTVHSSATPVKRN